MGSFSPLPLYRKFDVDEILSQLNPDEKISLLSGSDAWHTAPVERLNIPKIRLTDGPNGVRGTKFFNGVPAACLPCGTALASTWDVDLLHRGGVLQAREAIAKGAHVILGPTTNNQRSPLGGRGFESFSEDPVLAGNISGATISGIQSMGVAATIKHFVCNDQEHERQSVDAVVSERALREIYLMPFQIAQRDSKPMAVMSSYNKVNGVHTSSSRYLIQDILRDDWGFDGLVMSDWFGTYSTSEALKAGLDLEMPGPSYIRGAQVKHALMCGLILPKEVDARVRNVLKLIQKTLPLGIPENALESTIDTPATASVLRSIASSSLVLLQNKGNRLPFSQAKSTAIIGPNAASAAYCGGGSAALSPYYAVSPLEGARNLLGVENVEYALGAPGWKKLPLLSELTRRKDGKRGLDVEAFLLPPSKGSRKLVDTFPVNTSDLFLADYTNPLIESDLFYLECVGSMTPEQTDEYEFSLSVAGTGQLFVDCQCIVDNLSRQTPGNSFFGAGTIEETGTINLQKGHTYEIRVSFGTLPTRTFTVTGTTAFGAGGFRVGCHRKVDAKRELDRAVDLAKRVDQVVLCVGLNKDWESEGYDRAHMHLPTGTDNLIRAVSKANSNTVVVVQSGTPVSMPWKDDVSALVQAWYGGNETGNAIADVVFGHTNPGGKLPMSFPIRNEDNPAFLNFRSEKGKTVYGEGVYVGYRYYEKIGREVAFPFGFGLSYTTFELSSLSVMEVGQDLVVDVSIGNTGRRDGAEVVQVYIAPPETSSVGRPLKELKGFCKVFVKVGSRTKASIRLSKKYALSFWDEQMGQWCQEAGRYKILVGNSSIFTPLSAVVELQKTSWWSGL